MTGKLIQRGRNALVLAAMAGMGCAAQAAAVHFDVLGTGYALASGNTYGTTDTTQNPNHVLGVTFETTAPSLHQLGDLTQGQSYAFQFGTVTMREEGNNGSNAGSATITQAEKAVLGVSAAFKFLEPLNDPGFTITGIVKATLGALSDPEVDYSIEWDDTVFSFGNGGQFTLSLNDLFFTRNNQAMEQWATLTLTSAPTAPNNGGNNNAVPEPGSLALAGLGLGIAGFAGRRRKQAAA